MDLLARQRQLQQRYDRENRLLEAVTKGAQKEAVAIWSRAVADDFTRTGEDPVRARKNDAIVLNTLLRKAAERGGVHPAELHQTVGSLTRDIENAQTLAALQAIMGHMVQLYCRLVHGHSMRHYTAPVRKTVLLIRSDLTGNLSLSHLAKQVGVSGSYLSDLFKRETGKTITCFVTECRISKAKQLLEDTQLQVQTVAQHCGMVDRHYFSRVFKKQTGMTPNQYRQAARSR